MNSQLGQPAHAITVIRSVTIASLALALIASQGSVVDAQLVKGHARDALSGLPLSQVRVSLATSDGDTVAGPVYTDTSGFFLLRTSRMGNATIHAVRLGYRRITAVPVELEYMGVLTLTLQMSSVEVLAPVLVEESGRLTARDLLSTEGFEFRRLHRGGAGFTDSLRIAQLGYPDVPELLQLVNPMLSIVRSGETGLRELLMRTVVRGKLTECTPYLFVDGIPRFGPAGDVLGALDPRRIYGVEVYRGAGSYPMEFPGVGVSRSAGAAPGTSRNECGLVAIWTRAR